MTIKSDVLIESKSLRESVINRIEVLEKVKKLALLPDDINMTVDMSASYCEVGIEAIKSVIKRNRDELESDGLKTLSGEELRSYKNLCGIMDNKTKSLTIFPRRALLRICMLLQESEVAKAVRSYLLDSEQENKQPVTPVIAQATGVEDLIIMQAHSVKELKVKVAELEAQQIQDREKLDVVNNTVSSMADNLTAIPDSSVINKTINEIIRWTRLEHEDIFKKSYEVLKQKHGFDVVTRVRNERDRIQRDYFEKKGKYYAESTIKQKVNGIDVVIRNGWAIQYLEVLTGWLTKEKTKSTLRLVQ